MNLEINITKEILTRSAKCTVKDIHLNCAIALAIQEIFPQASVGVGEIFLFRSPNVALQTAMMSLPIEAINFIYEFDGSTAKERIQMKPFKFNIDIPQQVIDEINIDEITEIIKNSSTLEMV